MDDRERGETALETGARGPAGLVSIEQEDDPRDAIEERALVVGQSGAEERDGRDPELREAQDVPGTFDDDEVFGAGARDAVEVVQESALWQPRGELPLAPEPGLAAIEAAAGVAEGAAVGVVKPHGDAALEEAAATIGPDLEGARCFGMDAFGLEKAVDGVEGEAPSEGAEGGLVLRRGRGRRRSR